MSDNDAIWQKIDKISADVNSLRQSFASVRGRVDTMESRMDLFLSNQSEARAEFRTMLSEVQKTVSKIEAEAHERNGYEKAMVEASKQSNQWRQWIVPTMISLFALLATLGIISGGSN